MSAPGQDAVTARDGVRTPSLASGRFRRSGFSPGCAAQIVGEKILTRYEFCNYDPHGALLGPEPQRQWHHSQPATGRIARGEIARGEDRPRWKSPPAKSHRLVTRASRFPPHFDPLPENYEP